MEIRFYDKNLNFLGIMENQMSLVWTRKFYEPGKARLFAPITAENIELTRRGNIMWIRGAKEAAVIEDRFSEDTIYKSQMEVNGRFLSSYMDRRLIRPTVSYSGTVEVAMRQLLDDAYAIPRVALGTLNGFEDEVSFTATYKNLLTYETKLSKCSNIGFRFRPDFNEKAIYFETYKGKDRSVSQSENTRVIFSELYDNLNEMSYRENEQLLKNVVYIGGAGTGSDRVFTSFGNATGLERRELFVDARDILQEELSLTEYKKKLVQRGKEKQTDYQLVEAITCKTNAEGNFTYKTHYDLGDIVTVRKKAWGISVDLRITEIQEIYERGIVQVSPVFGDPLPEKIDWSDD